MDGNNITFKEFAERWFEDYAKDHLRTRTYYEDKKLTPRIYAAIGHIKIEKLKPHHLAEFYKNLAEDGINKRTGGGLAPKTIKHYHSLISTIMERAYKWGMIKENPCRRVDPPKVTKKEIDCLNDEEIALFLAQLEKESIENQAIFLTLLLTGMRRGELLGLEWDDIDFDNQIISIRRTSQYTAETGVFTDTTKTEQSKRSIKVSATLIDILKQHRAAQLEQRLTMGDRWQECGRVFTSLEGKPMSTSNPLNRLKKILKRAGLREVTLHSLRHTNASLLIGQGVNVRTVSGRLGHSNTSTTMNIYAHQIQSADAAAAEALDIAIMSKVKRA